MVNNDLLYLKIFDAKPRDDLHVDLLIHDFNTRDCGKELLLSEIIATLKETIREKDDTIKKLLEVITAQFVKKEN